ncbi:USP6 N-terminal-like protein isoform X2 [Varroa jacobsoni]|uniref:USP6 N-terminal-like protein isoform X2 n=1 Tax=Varroa jacobsoni TaxID=62625 RepID=UPI000BF478BD|nr:USP6 N-terminal-like protein isoform X2 [Varroa jacobsoni]
MSSDSESETERQVAAERSEIVAKYDKGWLKDSEHILPWEDPSYDEAAKIDRYGFIHEKALPERFSELEKKQLAKEVERGDKWLKMTKSWSKYMTNASKHELLRSRVYKGIPDRIRGDAWKLLLNVDELSAQQPTKYQEMKQLARKESPDIRQIDLDINRTYRNHEMFRQRYSIKQQELFHVLAAYSMYNQEVGYCQGMSQIAALLLMYMGEEEAFWAISQLMAADKFAMHGFFIQGFPKLARFTAHHDRILAKKLPKLKKHLDKHDIGSSMYTLKWFFQCFLDRVPFTLTLRLWDVYLLEGEIVLTAMSYTLLKLHRRNLLRMGMDQLVHFLQYRLEQDFGYNDDAAMEALQQCMQELKTAKLSLPSCTDEDRELERPTRPFGIVDNIGVLGTPRGAKKTSRIKSTSSHRKSSSVRALNINEDTESVLNGSIETISTKSEAGGRFTPKELRKSPNLVESEHSDTSSVVENLSLRMTSSLALDTSVTVTQDESSTRTLNFESTSTMAAPLKPRSPSIYDNVSLAADTSMETTTVQLTPSADVPKATAATTTASTIASSPLEGRISIGATTGTQTTTPPYTPTGRFPVEAVRIFVPYQSRESGCERSASTEHVREQRPSPSHVVLPSPSAQPTQGHGPAASPTNSVQDPNRITIKVHGMTTVETL